MTSTPTELAILLDEDRARRLGPGQRPDHRRTRSRPNRTRLRCLSTGTREGVLCRATMGGMTDEQPVIAEIGHLRIVRGDSWMGGTGGAWVVRAVLTLLVLTWLAGLATVIWALVIWATT